MTYESKYRFFHCEVHTKINLDTLADYAPL